MAATKTKKTDDETADAPERKAPRKAKLTLAKAEALGTRIANYEKRGDTLRAELAQLRDEFDGSESDIAQHVRDAYVAIDNSVEATRDATTSAGQITQVFRDLFG